MAEGKSRPKQKLKEAMQILALLDFGPKQSNELAGYVFLALLNLDRDTPWSGANNPLRGITPLMEFIGQKYRVKYAPNTRETVRDEAVKYFVDAGMLLRNPDHPSRPTNSGNTVYQIEPAALALFRTFGTELWASNFEQYNLSRATIRGELERQRTLARIPVLLPNKDTVTLSPGGQNPLIKSIIEEFCSQFSPGATVVYIGDAEKKFLHLDAVYLKNLGVVIAAAAKMPDVVVHDTKRNWLLLIEAVTSVGPVDGKRRKELKELFQGCKAGLVFVTAFESRRAMQNFLTQISWETEVWIAEDPAHIIHFNGERFLGPYPDVMPKF
ncbi:MAG: restriction endonuclease [Verrucomicrobiales bacterium]|nr:restriction endonuclease [Verrucomicrobiales bacterium]